MSLSLKYLNCTGNQTDCLLKQIWQSEIDKANNNVKILQGTIENGRKKINEIFNLIDKERNDEDIRKH